MLYITLVINVVAMGALIAGILMHSGRGGGLSDMFGGGGGAALGSSAAERNLNRITFVFALVWIFTVLALPFPVQLSPPCAWRRVDGQIQSRTHNHVGVAEWQTR